MKANSKIASVKEPSPEERSIQRLYYSVMHVSLENSNIKKEISTLSGDVARLNASARESEKLIKDILVEIGAAEDRVRNQFSYRLGRLLTDCKTLPAFFRLPGKIASERRAYKAQLASAKKAAAPALMKAAPGMYFVGKVARRMKIDAGPDALVTLSGKIIAMEKNQAANLRAHLTGKKRDEKIRAPIKIKGGAFSMELGGRDGGLELSFTNGGDRPFVLVVTGVEVQGPSEWDSADQD